MIGLTSAYISPRAHILKSPSSGRCGTVDGTIPSSGYLATSMATGYPTLRPSGKIRGNEHHYHQKVNTLVLHDLSRDYSGRWVDGFYPVACWRFQRRRPFRHRCCLERNWESNVCGVSLRRPTVRAARAMGATRWRLG